MTVHQPGVRKTGVRSGEKADPEPQRCLFPARPVSAPRNLLWTREQPVGDGRVAPTWAAGRTPLSGLTEVGGWLFAG